MLRWCVLFQLPGLSCSCVSRCNGPADSRLGVLWGLLLFTDRLLHQLHVVASLLGKGVCRPFKHQLYLYPGYFAPYRDIYLHQRLASPALDCSSAMGSRTVLNCLSLHPSLYLTTFFAGALQLFDCIQGFLLGWTQGEGLLSIRLAYAEPRIGMHRSRLFQNQTSTSSA
jgi:hypothetical protein